MKVVVDNMPDNPRDCIFNKFYNRDCIVQDRNICQFDNQFCNNTIECKYLITHKCKCNKDN